MTVIEVSDETFQREVLQSTQPVVVEFTAAWCGPCKAMAPALDAAAAELQAQIKFVKLDVDASPRTTGEYGVRGMPTLLLFKDGKPATRHVGAIMLKQKLVERIRSFAAQADAATGPRAVTFRLANGMDVVVVEDKHASDITHTVYMRAGAADAPAGAAGVAYVLSCLMSGANSPRGSTTGHDVSCYTRRTSKEELATVMQRSADHLANFRFTDEEVEAVRLVTMQRYPKGADYGQGIGAAMVATLYGTHPYAVSVVGLEEDMAVLSRERVMQFHAWHYAPNNAVLVVTGDVSVQDIQTLAEATYGNIAANPNVRTRSRPRLELPATPSRLSALGPADFKTWFYRKYLVPGRFVAPGDAAPLALIVQVLGGRSGLLRRRLVDEEKLAQVARVDCTADGLDLGTLSLMVYAPDGASDRIEAIVDEAFDEIRANGVSGPDLQRAKEAVTSEYSGASHDADVLASRYGMALALGRSIAEADAWPASIAGVTNADIQRTAEVYLHPCRRVSGWLVPEVPHATL